MIESYKVIEERLTPSGRIEYLTLPLYFWLTEDEVAGKTKMVAKPYQYKKSMKGIHSFLTKDEAVAWMQEHFLGYSYTRPALYRCESENDKCEVIEGRLVSEEIHFLEPILQMVNGKISDYVKMTVPEKKKPQFGIVYDESQINGDVEPQKDNTYE